MKSFLKQFQYKSEAGESNMTRSRRTSASPPGDKDKEQPNDGKYEKSLEERIRDDQDKFMKKIRETQVPK